MTGRSDKVTHDTRGKAPVKRVTNAPSTQAPGPDWDKVPFHVGCARCGQDLRGLCDPVCPRCSLTFDWTEAVPIEELTCGRCGYHLYGLSRTRCSPCILDDGSDPHADGH